MLVAALAFVSGIQAAEPAVTGTPKIEFETNLIDFGKIVSDAPMAGHFKFKNTGDAPLVIEGVAPSCECTEAKAIPEKLAPGESGIIKFTIKMEHALSAQRHIIVRSNDPKTPSIELNAQFDYTPRYEADPLAVHIVLPAGKDSVPGSFTITRTDGRDLEIDRLTTSADWITAAFDPTYEPKGTTGLNVSLEPAKNSARVNVTVHRAVNPAGLINGTVSMWSSNFPDHPVRVVTIKGEIQAELVANPAQFYWVLVDHGKEIKDYPAESICRHIELRSTLDKPVEITKATCNILGTSVKVVPKDAGKTFDLIVKFDELPKNLVEGKILVETSLPSVPKLEVPITVASPF